MTEAPLLQLMGLPLVTLYQAESAKGFDVATVYTTTRAYRGGARRSEVAVLAAEGWRDARRSAQELAAWRFGNDPTAPLVEVNEVLHGRPPRTSSERLAAAQGDPMFRTIARVRDVSLSNRNRLDFTVQPTYYYYLLGTNQAALKRLGSRDADAVAELDWLTAAERSDMYDLRGSVLANPLTVNAVVTAGSSTSPEVLIQVRKPGPRPSWTLQTSAAGFVDFDDIRGLSVSGAVAAVVREAREETGIKISPASIRFTAFARVQLVGFTGLSAHVALPSKPTRVAPMADSSFEVDGFEWWPWSPEATLAHVKEQTGGWGAFNPVGGAAIVHALVAEFGEERVRRAWHA